MGHTITAEDRSHRLSMADPPLYRSDCSLSFRNTVRSRSRGRALRGHAIRHRKRVLESPRRTLHFRRDDQGVRPFDATAGAPCHNDQSCRYGAARIFLRKRRDCSLHRSASARMFDDDLEQLNAGLLPTTRSTAGAVTQRRTHDWPTNKGSGDRLPAPAGSAGLSSPTRVSTGIMKRVPDSTNSKTKFP